MGLVFSAVPLGHHGVGGSIPFTVAGSYVASLRCIGFEAREVCPK